MTGILLELPPFVIFWYLFWECCYSLSDNARGIVEVLLRAGTSLKGFQAVSVKVRAW
jgi:hypothetical protein